MNTNKMKAIFAGLLLAGSTLTVSTGAMAGPKLNSDEICLLTGKLAFDISTAREKGTSEEKLLAATSSKTTILLINYVFTTGFDPQSIRHFAYMKCKSGEYL